LEGKVLRQCRFPGTTPADDDIGRRVDRCGIEGSFVEVEATVLALEHFDL
jgi:hypothetical protein